MSVLIEEAGLSDAPPSVKLVWVLLQHDDLAPLTPTELVETTDLGSETVRVALRELEDRGLVSTRRRPTDGRERLFEATA